MIFLEISTVRQVYLEFVEEDFVEVGPKAGGSFLEIFGAFFKVLWRSSSSF
jgi:hypothetical protein